MKKILITLSFAVSTVVFMAAKVSVPNAPLQ
jgi:hypothetical protein